MGTVDQQPPRQSPAISHGAWRPAWICVIDAAQWPCLSAREALADAYRTDPDGLFALLAKLLEQAVADLREADPTRLHRRFIAWALPEGQACRACGKAGHDAIPGIPPRLLPCEVADRLRLMRSDADPIVAAAEAHQAMATVKDAVLNIIERAEAATKDSAHPKLLEALAAMRDAVIAADQATNLLARAANRRDR